MHRRRDWWLKHHPFCWYCDAPLVYYSTPGGGELPPDFATIEHLYSKAVSQRNTPPKGAMGRTLVLACNDCNQLRGYWDVLLTKQPLTDWYNAYFGKTPRPRRAPAGPPALLRLYEDYGR